MQAFTHSVSHAYTVIQPNVEKDTKNRAIRKTLLIFLKQPELALVASVSKQAKLWSWNSGAASEKRREIHKRRHAGYLLRSFERENGAGGRDTNRLNQAWRKC
uniref:Uncharacterized protein n=1 Tax=Sphaerodactylus townsendi TaxID=933632 RepID=A0ACB8EB34_9SAUR